MSTTPHPFSVQMEVPSLADLHIYSPMNDIPHLDNTITFICTRTYVPLNDTISLASYVVPCPGDPDHNNYEDSVPNFPHAFVIGLGQVTGRGEQLPNGSRLFRVAFQCTSEIAFSFAMLGMCFFLLSSFSLLTNSVAYLMRPVHSGRTPMCLMLGHWCSLLAFVRKF